MDNLDLKPSKKIIVTTLFILAAIFVAEVISNKVELLRNNAIYEFLTKENSQKFDSTVNALEDLTKGVNEEYKKPIKKILYKYLALKWSFLLAFSYLASCLLFRRLKSFE